MRPLYLLPLLLLAACGDSFDKDYHQSRSNAYRPFLNHSDVAVPNPGTPTHVTMAIHPKPTPNVSQDDELRYNKDRAVALYWGAGNRAAALAPDRTSAANMGNIAVPALELSAYDRHDYRYPPMIGNVVPLAPGCRQVPPIHPGGLPGHLCRSPGGNWILTRDE